MAYLVHLANSDFTCEIMQTEKMLGRKKIKIKIHTQKEKKQKHKQAQTTTTKNNKCKVFSD